MLQMCSKLNFVHLKCPLTRRVCISSFTSPRDFHRSETSLIASQSAVVREIVMHRGVRADIIAKARVKAGQRQ